MSEACPGWRFWPDLDRSAEALVELAAQAARMNARVEPERDFADELREHQAAQKIYHRE